MILEVRDLYTSYGLSQILFGISLEMRERNVWHSLAAMGSEKPPRCAALWG